MFKNLKFLLLAAFVSLFTIASLKAQQKNKCVGIGYSVWFSNFHNNSIKYYHDKSKNPGMNFGPFGTPHWWGDPFITQGNNNYVLMNNNDRNDPNDAILDYHADLLYQAKVDFIGLDLTNGNHPLIVDEAKAVCLRYTERLALNLPSPQIVFFVKDKIGIDSFINNVWNNNLYNQSVFFRYSNKPLILVTGQYDEIPSGEPYDNFTIQKMWGLLANTNELWSFKQNVSQNNSQGYFSSNGWPEQMSVCAATQQYYMYNDNNSSLINGRKGRDNANYWNNQWSHVNSTNPSILFIWSWNEWVSQNLSETTGNGVFTDIYNYEYSADLEPDMAHGDLWYTKLKNEVDNYKKIVPNIALRNMNNGRWDFKFYQEEVAGDNDKLLRNFSQTFDWASGSHYQSFMGDFNDDGRIDIALRNVTTGTIHLAFRNSQVFHFNHTENKSWPPGTHYQPFVGDFNNDGLTDIGIRDAYSGTWYFCLKDNASNYTYSVVKTFNWAAGAHYQPYVGDFDNNGYTDIGMRDPSTGVWFFRLKYGVNDYSYSVQQSFNWAAGTHYQPFVTYCNLDDENIDIGMRDATTGKVYVIQGYSNFVFGNQYIFKSPPGNNYKIHMVGKKNGANYRKGVSDFIESDELNDNKIGDFKIYPNPCSSVLHFPEAKTDQLKTIYDLNGHVLLKTTENYGIDVSSLKAGIYIVELEGYNERKKLIKF